MSSENVAISEFSDPLVGLSGDAQPVGGTVDYLRSMNLDPEGGVDQCLAIMCKMGTSTESVDVLERMILAGMTIAMIPSDEKQWEHDKIKETVARIREANGIVSKKMNMLYPLAIALRVQGTEVYTGENEDGEDSYIQLATGSEVTVTVDPAFKGKSNDETIYIDYPMDMFEDLALKPRHRVFFNRGEIRFRINDVNLPTVSALCHVVKGGALHGHTRVEFPDNLVDMQTVTDDVIKTIQLGIDLKLDMIILRYAQRAEDIEKVRQYCKENDSRMKICACIMDHRGFQMVDELIQAADGIVIVRGYLGSKPLSWNLLLASRTIISKCRSLGKPSIFTTRFMLSVNKGGEISLPDIANAAQVVLEGADCFNIANEVASGPDPVKCIKLVVTICKEANKHVDREDLINDIAPMMLCSGANFQSVNVTAVRLSLSINAVAILVLTTSGDSACRVSQLRPFCPIIAVTRVGLVARQLQLFKYVHPLHYILPRCDEWFEDVDARIQFGIVYGKRRGFIRPGDVIVVLHGFEKGSGTNNTIRLMFASGQETG